MFTLSTVRPLLARQGLGLAALPAVACAGARSASSGKHKPVPEQEVSDDGLVRDDFFYARMPEKQMAMFNDKLYPISSRAFAAQHRPLLAMPPIPDMLEGLPGQFPEPLDGCYVPMRPSWQDMGATFYEPHPIPRSLVSQLGPFDADGMAQDLAEGYRASTSAAALLPKDISAAAAATRAANGNLNESDAKAKSAQDVLHVCSQFVLDPAFGEAQFQGALAIYLPQRSGSESAAAKEVDDVSMVISRALRQVHGQQMSEANKEAIEQKAETTEIEAAMPESEDVFYEATSVRRKRKLKMNRHKYRKRLKQTRTLRRRLGK